MQYDPVFQAWTAPITTVEGIGEKVADRLGQLIGGKTVLDLVFHLPTRWTDRRVVDNFETTTEGETQTVRGIVQNFAPAGRGSKVQRVRLADDTGFLTLVFFNPNTGYLQKQLPVGTSVVVSGKIEDFHGQRQITHPEYIVPADKIDEIPLIEPVYPLQAGMTNRRLHGFIRSALSNLPDLPEWQRADVLKKHNWQGCLQSLRNLHQPENPDEIRIRNSVERLAYDEALARALRFREIRQSIAVFNAVQIVPNEKTKAAFGTALTYAPTEAQTRSMAEISADIALTTPMQRMLQGDVGSGKTTVAAYAAYLAAAEGHQVAIMAPTEVLARQLYAAISTIILPLGINSACLTGRDKGAERKRIVADTASGDIQVLCGTHALFQSGVEFNSLGLVIIDEQHRFGVNDRAKLASKGLSPHLLIMSATPIPRSLSMTLNGDIDLSILDEKPIGRQPIDTRVIPDTRLDSVFSAVSRAVSRGEQVFWVCPRVEEDEDGRAAITRYAMLDEILEKPVGLVHGRLPAIEKEAALEAFRNGETSVLIATTVIEVGVDVPAATIIVIEGAEQFGLAQLHQLRGRVGRGSDKSYCLLIYTPPLGETATKRLDTLRKSQDGFYIAEVDFKLRGPGDILGLAQSGIPIFRVLDLGRDQGLLAMANKDAEYEFAQNTAGGDHIMSDALRLLVDLLAPKGSERTRI